MIQIQDRFYTQRPLTRKGTMRVYHSDLFQNIEDDEARAQWEADKPLSERLKVPRAEPLDPIPIQLLRKVTLLLPLNSAHELDSLIKVGCWLIFITFL